MYGQDELVDNPPLQELISNSVLQYAPLQNNLGLFHGKMGIAIYLYQLSRITKNPIYEEHADTLLDDIFEGVRKNVLSCDFENGLAGIAWGIEYLVRQGYVEANTDDILGDLDDKVFQHLTSSDKHTLRLNDGLLGYGFYLLSRLEGKQLDGVLGNDFILKRILVTVVNSLYDAVEGEKLKIQEPVMFQSTWDLPWLLVLLADTRKLGIYEKKVDTLIDRLSFNVLCMFPILHCNRLFLLLSIKRLLEVKADERWQEHANILEQSISPQKVANEFSDKNVSVSSGMSGLVAIEQLLTGECQYTTQLRKRMSRSIHWKDQGDKNMNPGIFNGMTGIGLAVHFSETPKPKPDLV